MTQNLAAAGVYLIQTGFGLYTFFIMVRFLMQVSRVDYYNPLCQGIVRITDPAIKPLRMLLPRVRNVDIATLGAAFVVQMVAVMIIMVIKGYTAFAPIYIGWVLLGLFSNIFDIYFFALIVRVIVSWVAPGSNHPAILLVEQIIEPLCMPARKILPPMGGLDFSIILVFVFIHLIDNILVIKPLAQSIGLPSGLIFGL